MGPFAEPYHAWATHLPAQRTVRQISASNDRFGRTVVDKGFCAAKSRTNGRLVARLKVRAVVSCTFDVEKSAVHFDQFSRRLSRAERSLNFGQRFRKEPIDVLRDVSKLRVRCNLLAKTRNRQAGKHVMPRVGSSLEYPASTISSTELNERMLS